MKLTNEIKITQKQNMTQKQIMTVNLLAMTNAEMQSYIQSEYDTNPMIDHHLKENEETHHTEMKKVYASERSDYNFSGDEQSDEEEQIPMKEDQMLRSNVMMQLRKEDFDSNKWKILNQMTYFLNEKGYLNLGLSEIAEAIDQPLSLVKECHTILSDLSPVGIFSTSVAECLLKQLKVMNNVDERLIIMVEDYSEELAKGNRTKIVKELKISKEEFNEFLEILSNLRINPITVNQVERSQYIIPDIIIKRIEDTYEILINDGWMGQYYFNDYYLHLMHETTDPTLKEYLTNKYQKSKFLFDCIEMRRETIIRIMREIIKIQGDFFFRHYELMPMTMDDIAMKIEMNISTVSRALREKYIEYPYGSILAKKLFTQSIKSETGEDKSKNQVEQLILETVKNENKNTPLSDGQIEKIMKEQGIQISRRTISKYRKELGILDSYNRKYQESSR